MLASLCVLLIAASVHGQDRRGVALGGSLPVMCVENEGFVIPSGGSKGLYSCGASNNWTLVTDFASAGGSSVPSGAILLIDSGACPSGYSEVAGLDGKTIVGTLAANGNVGSTGGSDSITPQGSISAINQVINHTHTVTVTDPGHTHVERIINSGTAGTVGVQGASAAANANASNAPTASSATGISAVTANPAGGVASITPTFTGTAFDNRSAFARVIFCRKA